MNTIDPLERANILARFQRTQDAIAALRRAIQHEPLRSDLQARLAELAAERPSGWPQRLRVWGHLAMAWVLLVASTAAAFAPVYLAIRGIGSLAAPAAEPTTVVLWAIGGIAALVAFLYVAMYLFLYLWFAYLRLLANVDLALVERQLPSVLRVDAFEPQYSRIRERFFPAPHVT